jgi:FkbM family methyltransferase
MFEQRFLYCAGLLHLIGKVPLIGRALRFLARRYEEGSETTVALGYASGTRWKRYHRYVSGYWLGQYELPIQEAIIRLLGSESRVFDVGANAGFFSLVAAKKVGRNGWIVAFDPLKENAECIAEQFRINSLSNCHIDQRAVTNVDGWAEFSFDKPGSSTAHLGIPAPGESSIKVQTTTLDNAAEKWGIPTFIKLDVEGAEVRVLEGAKKLLEMSGVVWLIELHNPDCTRDATGILRKYGYDICDLKGRLLRAETEDRHIVAFKPG